MTTDVTDRIERKTVLRAPRSRVWNAISDSKEFGAWFQVKIDGPFEEGAHVTGSMTYPGHEGSPFAIWVETVQPESLFSYRWHPYEIDPAVDAASQPATLVEFRLSDAPGGTQLTITESGFDGVPLAQRAQAFTSHTEGWDFPIEAVSSYVGG